MIEIFGGIVTTPALTRQDFLNVPVPINEDWRVTEIRFYERHKYNCIAEVHFNRDMRHTIWAHHFAPPFYMDEKIIGGTYITAVINNRTDEILEGAFYLVVEREQVGKG